MRHIHTRKVDEHGGQWFESAQPHDSNATTAVHPKTGSPCPTRFLMTVGTTGGSRRAAGCTYRT